MMPVGVKHSQATAIQIGVDVMNIDRRQNDVWIISVRFEPIRVVNETRHWELYQASWIGDN